MKQHRKADEEGNLIVKKMLKHMNNFFNNEYDYHTNQQLIGHKYLLRCVIVKEWVMDNCNSVNSISIIKF